MPDVIIGKTTLITDKAKLATSISEVSSDGVKFNDKIQLVGLSAMYAAQQHGNSTPLMGLINALPGGVKTSALIAWIEQTCPASVKLEKGRSKVTLTKGRTKEDFDLEAAEADAWHTFKPAPKVQVMDLDALLKLVDKKLDISLEQEHISHQCAKDLMEAIRVAIVDAKAMPTPAELKAEAVEAGETETELKAVA